MSLCPEASDGLVEIAKRAGYQDRRSFSYGPFKHSPPSNPRNARAAGCRDDYFLLKEKSFPKIVTSVADIRDRIYRNLLVQADRKDIYILLTLPHAIPTSTETLLHATKDFKQLYPPHEDPKEFTGACMTVPGQFAKLCQDRYGIVVELPHFGDGVSFFHEVAVRGNIVVDWTVRQFEQHREAPYPYIYRMGSRNAFLGGVVERDKDNSQRLISRRDI